MITISEVVVVMVGTTHPGNIGAAARAMGVMGLHQLLLVRPKARASDDAAIARAAGANHILAGAVTFPDLAGALANTQRAYAFTARRRGIGHVLLDPHEASQDAVATLAAGNRVALVFGPEQSGLTNEETRLCDCIVEIPTTDTLASLNVAAAIQVACYELRMRSSGQVPLPARDLASKEEIELALAHAYRVIEAHQPAKHDGLRNKLHGRLRLLLNRAQPATTDIRMLRGLLSNLDKSDSRD